MVTRRDFLKKSGQAALAVGGGLMLEALFTSCATTGFTETGPVIYPPLKGHKVQPPKEGCYIGFHRDFWKPFYESMVEKIGKKPKIMIPSVGMAANSTSFPKWAVKYVASKDAIPFIYRDLSIDILLHGFGDLVDNKEFRKDITKYAKDIVKFSEPIFLCTMRELNGDWFPWGQKPEMAKKVWQLMWQIFEDNGANEYATWVWEVYSPAVLQRKVDSPEEYYPGDKYVDWIGLSAYGRLKPLSPDLSFSFLEAGTYRDMRNNHPEKPIMQAEFGRTKDKRQPRWIENAYETIKSWRGMKAAIYWDSVNYGLGDDDSLSEESMKVLKQVLKDPYFRGIG